MVSVAERATAGLAAATMLTAPLPLPLLPDEMVSQDALLLAVHAQPAPAETLTLAEPPAAGTVKPDGPSPIVHPLPWVTVKVWPAIVNVPDRTPPVVPATLYCTVPLPFPLAPEVIESQDALVVAVHAQPAPLVRPTLPVPPDAGMLAEVCSSAKVQ